MKNKIRDKIDKTSLVIKYIDDFIKILPITNIINDDIVLKQEIEILITTKDERSMEK